MAGESGGPATLTAPFVPKCFGKLRREEEAKIPLLSCTGSLSYKRLNKYPGQFRQKFVNPLKACKIWVECGCFPWRRLWWWCCCSGEVRVGCCFPRWVWCIPLVLWSCPGPPKPRQRMCPVRCRLCLSRAEHGACPCAPAKPCRPGSIWTWRESSLKSGKNFWDKFNWQGI